MWTQGLPTDPTGGSSARRTFPDGHCVLMLVVARLRHQNESAQKTIAATYLAARTRYRNTVWQRAVRRGRHHNDIYIIMTQSTSMGSAHWARQRIVLPRLGDDARPKTP